MSELETLKQQIEAQGYLPDSYEYELAYAKGHVELCKQRRNISSCPTCPVFNDCDVIKTYLRVLKYTPHR